VLAEAPIACQLCGSSSFTHVFAALPALQRCLHCGLVAGRSDARASYDEDYFANGGYRAYFDRAPQWRFEARRRLRWLQASARPRRLLEIGCAGGFFLAEARRSGVEVHGVELSSVAARHAREVLALPLTEGAFEEAELPHGFDAVCAFHVLEHVAEPRRFLEKAHGLLSPGGVLALEVPNIASARAARAGSRWADIQLDHHRWHFTPSTLARLVCETGFAMEHCETVFLRHYRPPAARISRAQLALATQDWRAARSLRTVHPSAGDYLRLLTRKP